MCSEENFCVIFVNKHSFLSRPGKKNFFAQLVLCNFFERYFLSANRPKFQHPSSFGGGGFFTVVVQGRARTKRKRRRRRRRRRRRPRANDSFLERSLHRLQTIGEDTREREALRGGQRAKKDKCIDPTHLFFCVQENDFDEKKRRERGRKRGFFFFFFFSKTRARPLPSLSLVESSSKDRSSRPVAVYRRRRRVAFMFCISFSEKPKDKKVLTF